MCDRSFFFFVALASLKPQAEINVVNEEEGGMEVEANPEEMTEAAVQKVQLCNRVVIIYLFVVFSLMRQQLILQQKGRRY